MSSDRNGTPDNAKLPPLSDSEWPKEVADMLPGFAGGLNVYRMMAHHPRLLRAWSGLREHIVHGSALSKEDLEIVILRTGHRLQSQYEWSQHIERARKCGVSDARIQSIRGPLKEMTQKDALISSAVDELLDTSRLSKTTLAGLMADLGKSAVFDLMATVGFYSTLGFILNTFDTPLDDDITARLEANPLKENGNSRPLAKRNMD